MNTIIDREPLWDLDGNLLGYSCTLPGGSFDNCYALGCLIRDKRKIEYYGKMLDIAGSVKFVEIVRSDCSCSDRFDVMWFEPALSPNRSAA